MNNSLISPGRLWELRMVQVVLNRFAGVSCRETAESFPQIPVGRFIQDLEVKMPLYSSARAFLLLHSEIFFCHEGTFLSLSGGAFLWRHLWIKKESNHPVAVNIINVHVLGFLWEGTFQAMLRKELSHPSGGSQPPRSWKISLVTHSLCSFFESAVGCKTKSFFYRIFNFARVLKAVDPSQTSLDYSWNLGS